MEGVMRGLVKAVAAPSSLVYHDDLPIPQIKDDEVLIKVHCTAICGSDIHILDWDEWSKKRIKPPVTLGHETSGDIVAVGKNVTDRKVGDRVSCESHIPCGSCYFCTHGMPHICKDIQLFGCEAACMFETMGAGVHGVEAAQVAGKTVLVSGCGPIGMTAISACKTFGATKVFACDLLDSRLAIAKDMGADYVFNSAQVDLPAEILRLTDGLGADAAIDITGAQAAINADLKCLRAAGRMVCVGLPSGPVTLQDMTDDLIYREVTLTGVSGRLIWDTWQDFARVMSGPYYKLDKIIGGRYTLEQYEDALAAIRQGVPGKMLLYPNASDM